MNIENYIEPKLIMVSLVLYFIGTWLKKSEFIKDKYIPLVLGGLGILICSIWIFSTASITDFKSFTSFFFASITQGVLTAGLSTYSNQIYKQLKKDC